MAAEATVVAVAAVAAVAVATPEGSATATEEVATEAEEVAIAKGLPTGIRQVGSTAPGDAAAVPEMLHMANNLWVTRESALGKGLGLTPGGRTRTVGSSAAPKA